MDFFVTEGEGHQVKVYFTGSERFELLSGE